MLRTPSLVCKILLVSLELVVCGCSALASDFIAPKPVAAGGFPYAVALADFNGDGKLDAASTEVVTGGVFTVSVSFGNGDGTFGARSSYSLGYEPILGAITIGDFNHDGHPDLAVGVYFGLMVLINNGDGTFQPGTFYDVGGYPCQASSMAVGDFNGDNKLDLVASTVFCGVAYLQGNGDGTFQPSVNYPAGDCPMGLAAGDFNKDHKLDLVATNSGECNTQPDQISILIGNGDGTFKAPVSYPADESPLAVVVADFDGDGNLDVAVTNFVPLAYPTHVTNSVDVFLGNGDGTFRPRKSYQVGPYAMGLAVADFNGDGRPDLAAVNSSIGEVSVLIGIGKGNFRPAVHYAAGYYAQALAVGDLTGSGFPDVLTANEGSSNLSVLLDNPDGALSAALDYEIGTGTVADSVAIADFNGDGVPDVITANEVPIGSKTATLSVFLGERNRHFKRPIRTRLPGQPQSGVFVAIADFNHDGKQDVAVSLSSPVGDTVVTILLGKGDGRFTVGASYYIGPCCPGPILAADFNGDGKSDLATLGCGGGVCIMLGNGDGTFGKAKGYSTGAGEGAAALAIALGDFNNDGILDLAAVNTPEGNGNIAILIGNGDGTFQNPLLSTVNEPATTIAVGDFNHDGNPDLAVNQGSSVGILLGKGDGTFSPPRDFVAGGGPDLLLVGDFDGDDNPDLAVGISGGVSLLHGRGDGTFGVRSVYPVPLAPFSMAAGVLGTKGGLDLAVGSVRLTVYLNRQSK